MVAIAVERGGVGENIRVVEIDDLRAVLRGFAADDFVVCHRMRGHARQVGGAHGAEGRFSRVGRVGYHRALGLVVEQGN